MKFIKALQKTEAERRTVRTLNDEVEVQSEMPSEKDSEDFVARSNFRIGAPKPHVNEESQFAVGDTNTRIAVGKPAESAFATADESTLDTAFPEFQVDAGRVNPHLVSITQPSSHFAEEYRSLRTQIRHSSEHRLMRSIVIASVAPAEGKSVTALNLSWLMAQTDGVRVLLIDGDLRMPSLAKYLGFDTAVGLSQVLSGEASFREAIIKLQPAGLFLLPGGGPRPDVAELTSGPRLGEVLEKAYDLFDYVIIDAPPLGAFTDAAVLINNAEAALLVVRANHTRYKDIERKLESLPREKMLGVVLNQSDDVLLNNNYYDYAYPKAYII